MKRWFVLIALGALYRVESTFHVNGSTSQVATFDRGSQDVCVQYVQVETNVTGIAVEEDRSCYQGGEACATNLCRYCKAFETTSSSKFPPCRKVESNATASYLTPDADACEIKASWSIYIQGAAIVSDASCSEGKGAVGCLNDRCRLCKHFGSWYSGSFVPCSSIPSTFQAFDNDPGTCSRLSSQPAADTAQSLGIALTTDISCAAGGGVGCLDESCRFCRLSEAPLSKTYIPCDDISLSTDILAPQVVPDTSALPRDHCNFPKLYEATSITGHLDPTCAEETEWDTSCISLHCRLCHLVRDDQADDQDVYFHRKYIKRCPFHQTIEDVQAEQVIPPDAFQTTFSIILISAIILATAIVTVFRQVNPRPIQDRRAE